MEKFISMRASLDYIGGFGYLQSKLSVVCILYFRPKFILHNYCKFLGVFYISTYEGVRHILNRRNINSNIRAFIAGAAASLVGQTIIVPFDVLSQHLMMMGIGKKNDNMVIKHYI